MNYVLARHPERAVFLDVGLRIMAFYRIHLDSHSALIYLTAPPILDLNNLLLI